MSNVLTTPIGQMADVPSFGAPFERAVVARRDGITVTEHEVAYPAGEKHLDTWHGNVRLDGTEYAENTGMIFGQGVTPDEAIDRALKCQRGWAGISAGYAETEREND